MTGLLHAACLLRTAMSRLHPGEGPFPIGWLYNMTYPRRCGSWDQFKEDWRVQDENANVPMAREGEIFKCIFKEDDTMDVDLVAKTARQLPLGDVMKWRDVDKYGLMEKAILYNQVDVIKTVLQETTMRSKHEEDIHFPGAAHMAAFLGLEEVLSALADHDRSLVTLPGAVRINHVNGPSCHLLHRFGYSSSRYSDLTKRVHWVSSHTNETPVHYAIAGDHTGSWRFLCQSSGKLSDDEKKSMVQVGVACCSVNCLKEMYVNNPDDMYLRDHRGRLLVGYGLTHGVLFLKFLLDQGFNPAVLNNIDEKGEINALHQFYSSLARTDYSLSKYQEVGVMTRRLLDHGVKAEQSTDAFRSHGVKDTPLHLLLGQVNMIVCKNRIGLFVPNLSDVQRMFDISLNQAVGALLEQHRDIGQHLDTLLRRLFVNRNFISRYKLAQDELKDLSTHAFGLENMYTLAEMILTSKSMLTICSRRREFSPLLCLIDSLKVEGGISCVFSGPNVADVFEKCVVLLLSFGDNPNVYPFFGSENSYCSSPLIHLIDLYTGYFLGELEFPCMPLTPSSADSVCRISENLISHGAKLTCHLNINRLYLKHGVFDGLVILWRAIHRDIPSNMDDERLKVLKTLLDFFLKHGAEARVHDFLFFKLNMGKITDEALRYSLLHNFLLFFTQGIFDAGRTSSLLLNADYHDILRMLLNHAGHGTYYRALEDALGTVNMYLNRGVLPGLYDAPDSENHSKLMINVLQNSLRNPRDLQRTCRVAIHSTITGNDYMYSVKTLPLPTVLKGFLIDFIQ